MLHTHSHGLPAVPDDDDGISSPPCPSPQHALRIDVPATSRIPASSITSSCILSTVIASVTCVCVCVRVKESHVFDQPDCLSNPPPKKKHPPNATRQTPAVYPGRLPPGSGRRYACQPSVRRFALIFNHVQGMRRNARRGLTDAKGNLRITEFSNQFRRKSTDRYRRRQR